MPWTIKKQTIDGQAKHCVVDKDGKTVKCHSTPQEADKHRKALYANMPEEEKSKITQKYEAVMLEGVGPALLAVAATNKPHLRQRDGGQISLIKEGDKELVRVPIARKGIYSHPTFGKLVFNDATFGRMVSNYNNRVTDYPFHLDLRHKDTEGALALLDIDDGGSLKVEGDWLVAYGPPTDDDARKLLGNKRYRYASAEFHPNYESNLVERLSMDDLKTISVEDLEPETSFFISLTNYLNRKEKSPNMEILSDGAVKLTAVEFGDMEKRLNEATARIKELETKQAPATPPTQLENVPEAVKLQLEEMNKIIATQKREMLRGTVALALAKAEGYRDGDGRGHSTHLIDTIRKLMLGESLGENGSIKLENEAKPEDVAEYFRRGLIHLLETVPGQVPMQSKTVGDNNQPPATGVPANGALKYTEEELKLEYQNAWKGFSPAASRGAN